MGNYSTTALAVAKGSALLSMVGGGGLAANELMTPEGNSVSETSQIHKAFGPYQDWWNDMLKNEKTVNNAGLRDYEVRPSDCSKDGNSIHKGQQGLDHNYTIDASWGI